MDDFMAVVALGSLLMASTGIFISALNAKWLMDGKHLFQFGKRFIEPSPADLI